MKNIKKLQNSTNKKRKEKSYYQSYYEATNYY